jgi:hypothetical protein
MTYGSFFEGKLPVIDEGARGTIRSAFLTFVSTIFPALERHEFPSILWTARKAATTEHRGNNDTFLPMRIEIEPLAAKGILR